MKTVIALLGGCFAAPVYAQHSMPMNMPMPAVKPAAKAPPATKTIEPAAKPRPAKTKKKVTGARSSQHGAHPASHSTPAMEGMSAEEMNAMGAASGTSSMGSTGHDEAPAATGAHDGHNMGSMEMHGAHGADDGAMQVEHGPELGEPEGPPVSPPPPAALSGPPHAADTVFGATVMNKARARGVMEHGAITTSKLLVDQAEMRLHDGRDGYFVNGEYWYGGDIDRLRFTTEIEGAFGRSPNHAEVQALWSHALNPWFSLQTGIRYDVRPDPERVHLVAGVQGLAPYWLDVEAAAFLSNKGELTARIEGEYDQRITGRLILQPRVEFNLSAQDVPRIGIAAGLSTAEAGLRLRYQVVPEFAPYVGVIYEHAFGGTADFRRAEGESRGGWSAVLGLRTWF